MATPVVPEVYTSAAGVAASRVVVNGIWPARVEPEDGDKVAAASVDAALHWRRHCRHTALVTTLEAEVGACARVPFSFSSRPDEDAAELDSLFEEVTEPAR